MSAELLKSIRAAEDVRRAQSSELQTALAFAQLEIAEVRAGIRSLLHCPGIEQLASMIKKEKSK